MIAPMDKVLAPDGFEGLVAFAAIEGQPESHVVVIWRDGSKSAEPADQLIKIESYSSE